MLVFLNPSPQLAARHVYSVGTSEHPISPTARPHHQGFSSMSQLCVIDSSVYEWVHSITFNVLHNNGDEYFFAQTVNRTVKGVKFSCEASFSP